MSKTIVGILGIGRLGKVISRKLVGRYKLLLADKLDYRAKQLANKLGTMACSIPYLLKNADVILLVVPPSEIESFVQQYAGLLKPGKVVVNMATDIPTTFIREICHDKIDIIGAKLIGQAYAIANGSKGIFIISPWNSPWRPKVANILRPLGKSVDGEEMLAQEINMKATQSALKFVISLRQSFERLNLQEDIINIAIKTVAVGTILDYPPSNNNLYINNILNKMRQ